MVVALLTDHLAGTSFVGSELTAVLARTDERRLRFTVWAPDTVPETITRPGTHFDVMPTLMGFLGLSAWTEHYLGASLLRFESPWFSHDRPSSLRGAPPTSIDSSEISSGVSCRSCHLAPTALGHQPFEKQEKFGRLHPLSA